MECVRIKHSKGLTAEEAFQSLSSFLEARPETGDETYLFNFKSKNNFDFVTSPLEANTFVQLSFIQATKLICFWQLIANAEVFLQPSSDNVPVEEPN